MRLASSMATWTCSQPAPQLLPPRLPRAIAGDAMADAIEAAEFLDVEMDHVAGMVALIAADRLRRIEIAQARQARAPQDAADGGGRELQHLCDLAAGSTFPAQRDGGLDRRWRREPTQAVRPRRAVTQSFSPLGFEAGDPFGHGLHRDAECGGDSRGFLPVLHHPPGHLGSTIRGCAGIRVNVHPAPR